MKELLIEELLFAFLEVLLVRILLKFSFENEILNTNILMNFFIFFHQDAGCGYFEDRRPSSNCDPYSVVGTILSTICLNK